MTVSVIDLGDVSSWPDEPEDRPGGPRGFGRFRVNRLAKAGIAVVAALLLGGSGLPGPPVLRRMWSMKSSPAESMAVEGGTFYVRRSTETGTGIRTELAAYDLGTGTLRWTRDTGAGPAWMGVEVRAGVLLVPGDEQSVTVESADGSTIGYTFAGSVAAFDPATGEPLWKRPGAQYERSTGDTLLMYERSGTGTITSLRLVRARDGSVVWERRAPARTDTVVVQFDGGAPARVVAATPRGELTVLRWADGTPVITGPVPWRPLSSDTGVGSSLTAAAGRLVVVDTGLDASGDRTRLTVYRADDLAPLWSRDTTGWTNVQECGALLCVGTAEGVFEAVEPDTGRKRWQMAGNQFLVSVRGGERLLVAGTDENPEQTLVDAATGRVIGPGGEGNLLYVDDEEDTAVLLRSLDQKRSVVIRLDTGTGQSHPLGVIAAGDQFFCDGEGRWIACTMGDRLTVTAVG